MIRELNSDRRSRTSDMESNSSRRVDLDTIYGAESGPGFMTGIQALVRLQMAQRRLDRIRSLQTTGLVSGYRGSPLGPMISSFGRHRNLSLSTTSCSGPG